MLSLVDLVAAGSVTLELAGYLAAVMRTGASLLVGARPGGAGKTAVMVALLNFLPDHVRLRPVEGPAVLRQGMADSDYGDTCYLAHEIGDGFYYAYLWGDQAQMFFRLAGVGHIVASTLHADSLSEAQTQLCDHNRVAASDLAGVTLKVFLRISRGPGFRVRRWVNSVYESDGTHDQLVWQHTASRTYARLAKSQVVTDVEEERCSQFLVRLQERDVETLEAVRRAVATNL
jgi:hypothetical protein